MLTPDSEQPYRTPLAGALTAALAPALLLLPFLNKAYHVDDPFYLWVGEEIQESPLDFYGFSLYWEQMEQPAWQVNKNPPLVSYYMALVGWLFGWSERVMHTAFLLPAMAVGLGTYLLARRLTSGPLLATFIAVFSPVFLISASNVMAEVMMLAFYVWAVYLWVAGLEDRKAWMLATSGVCIALSTLTKYFGLSLLPLLVAYALVKRAPARLWAPWLFVPAMAALLYEVYTYRVYGQGLLLGAAKFTTGAVGTAPVSASQRFVTGLSYLGGCMLPVLFLAPLLWSWRYGILFVVLAASTLAYGYHEPFLYYAPGRNMGGEVVPRPILAHLAVFVPAAVFVLLLPLADTVRRRTPDAWLLLLWVYGTFLFAVAVNWTITGRALIALAPPAGILVARRLADRGILDDSRQRRWACGALVPAALVSLVLVHSDVRLANSARHAAREMSSPGALPPYSGQLWYLGHWGFQYYMEDGPGIAADPRRAYLVRGDVLVVPRNNERSEVPRDLFQHTAGFSYEIFPFVTVWNPDLGAGFYSALWGPLPFAFGRVPPEQYWAFLISRTTSTHLRANPEVP